MSNMNAIFSRALWVTLASTTLSQAASVYFGQTVDVNGNPKPLIGSSSLTGGVYAPIRDTIDGPITGYVEVTQGAQNPSPGGQQTGFPMNDNTDTYLYQGVTSGAGHFTTLEFRFVASATSNGGLTYNPVPNTSISVSEYFIRVDARPNVNNVGLVTTNEDNFITTHSAEATQWEQIYYVMPNAGNFITWSTPQDNQLTYTGNLGAGGVNNAVLWRAFDADGSESITGFSWLFSTDDISNGTHLQLDLTQIVPEPSVAMLSALAMTGMLLRRRRTA